MKVGRPRIYENVEDLDLAIESYFMVETMIDGASKCGNKLIGTGKFVPIDKPTITGLTLHLGFCDKTTLYDYRDRPEFSHSIKKALTLIEQYHEEGLTSNNVAGRIFALKNMGWIDKVEAGFTNRQGDDVAPKIIFQPATNCNDISDP